MKSDFIEIYLDPTNHDLTTINKSVRVHAIDLEKPGILDDLLYLQLNTIIIDGFPAPRTLATIKSIITSNQLYNDREFITPPNFVIYLTDRRIKIKG